MFLQDKDIDLLTDFGFKRSIIRCHLTHRVGLLSKGVIDRIQNRVVLKV